MNKLLVVMALVVTMVGCTKLEPMDTTDYKTKFVAIETGQSVDAVIAIMGKQPDDEKAVEVLGLSSRQLTWASLVTGKKYSVTILAGRVVGKSVL